jgi:hypothetical protein
LSVVSKSFPYGPHTVTIETGEVARQADGAVRVSMGDTVVMVTACAQQTAAPGRNFLPLTVNYIEKTYAAGRIPGGFFKREGRPTEKETLTSRLIDRPIRPLFPDAFRNDVQVVATVVSMDPDIDADIPGLLGCLPAPVHSRGVPTRRFTLAATLRLLRLLENGIHGPVGQPMLWEPWLTAYVAERNRNAFNCHEWNIALSEHMHNGEIAIGWTQTKTTRAARLRQSRPRSWPCWQSRPRSP